MNGSTIGDYFAFSPFRAPSATSWYKYAPTPDDSFQFAEGEKQKISESAKVWIL